MNIGDCNNKVQYKHMARPQSTKARSEEKEKGKKSKMRTASDVIARLLWDESLPKEECIVGYLDRFIGVVEEHFTTLDWRDPAVVDNHTLAIPKHRIQYFKYKNKRFWDKNSRLDIMYGSTGDRRKIHDFIKEVDEMDKKFFDEGIVGDDDDDAEHDRDPAHESEKQEANDVAYDNSDRSNFFVAVRITDPDTLENLNELRSLIILKDESLSECCILSGEYHMTLLTTRLNSAQEIQSAIKALNNAKSKVTSLPKIELNCLDVFRHRVLYCNVKCDEQLTKLRETLMESFTEQNINILDKFMFIPHVTVMKLSRPAVRSRRSKFIEPYLYLDFEEKLFGTQEVTSLALCEMGSSRREDGFYNTAVEIDLN